MNLINNWKILSFFPVENGESLPDHDSDSISSFNLEEVESDSSDAENSKK